MTIAKFRNIDLTIFTLLAVIIDFVLGRYGLFGLKMYLSISILIALLVIVRWRKWGGVTIVVLIVSHLITYNNNEVLVLIAHSLALASIGLFIFLEPKIRNKTNRFEIVSICYFMIYLFVIFIEWTLLLVFGKTISLGNFLVNQSVNFFLGLFILFIVHLQKYLLVDMQTYLIENQRKNLNEKNNQN